MVAILEGVLKFLFGAMQLFILLIINVIQKKPRQTIPPVKNNLLLQSATTIASKIRKREVKSSDVVKAYIARIEEVNPILNFVVKDRFADAVKDAEQVDEFLSTTSKTEEQLAESSPFLGVPCTIKESLAVIGLPHTAGLHSRKNIVAVEDAPVVAAIRKAGAIPLAVTNTPELCCWWETFNSLYGRTHNPYNTTHTAGGSSGGEGSAIGAAASLFGIGSDFAGSIRIPASFNGVFGHRPTSQITSTVDHYPVPANDELKKLLVTGPLTRYSSDLRPILKVITKDKDPDLNLDTPVDLKSIKVYYMEEEPDMFLTTSVQPFIKSAIRKTVQHLQSSGVKVERLHLKGMKYAMMYWYAKIKTDDGPQLGRELANHKGTVSVMKEFCKSLVGASKHTLPVLLFGVLEAGNGIPYKGVLHSAVLNESDTFEKDIKV